MGRKGERKRIQSNVAHKASIHALACGSRFSKLENGCVAGQIHSHCLLNTFPHRHQYLSFPPAPQTGKKKVVVLAEALTWSVVWVAMALAFAAVVYALRGRGPAVVWVTAYVLEKVLSVDNLFVFLTIFASFHTPTRLQHKVRKRVVGALERLKWDGKDARQKGGGRTNVVLASVLKKQLRKETRPVFMRLTHLLYL